MKKFIDIRRIPDVESAPKDSKDPKELIRSPIPFCLKEDSGNQVRVYRDPIGQMPVHYLESENHVFLANSVKDLLLQEGATYGNTRVLKHGSVLTVDDAGVSQSPYVDFYDYQPAGFEKADFSDVEYVATYVRQKFAEVITSIVGTKDNMACLLSGGVDSMVAAYLTSQIAPKSQAFTMGISSKAEDVAFAAEYARAFGLEHNIIKVEPEDIIKSVRESVWRSEIYHNYNVFCVVGMILTARHLLQNKIFNAISGEGANEAFGDYHNWDITQEDGSVKRIQTTDIETFNAPKGRHAYVWGNPAAEAKGFFNQQLGSGLAKHGVSRMYKPLNEYNVQLFSPFMQMDLLKVMASISASDLKDVGGKAGFMSLVFGDDIKQGKIPASFFNSKKKTRLQDANQNGQGGITETLLNEGFDQNYVIEMFNELFGANVPISDRFVDTKLI